VFRSPASDRGPGTDSKEEVVVVQAFVGEASESFDDTGTVLWPAAPLLCYFLLSDAGRRLVQGVSVLELGAGVGIPGLIAGRVCKTLVLTDHNDQVVERLETNVRLNRASLLASCQAVSVERLDWREFLGPSHGCAQQAAGKGDTSLCARTRYQVLLGADVVYSHEAVEMLVSAVDALLELTPDAVFLLAYVSRWSTVDEALTRSAALHHFALDEIAMETFLDVDASQSWLPEGAALYTLKRCKENTVSSPLSPWSTAACVGRASAACVGRASGRRGGGAGGGERGIDIRVRAGQLRRLLDSLGWGGDDGGGGGGGEVGSVLLDCTGPYVVEDEVVLALCRHVRAWSRDRRSSGRHTVTVPVTDAVSDTKASGAHARADMHQGCREGVEGAGGGGGDGVWEEGKGWGGGLTEISISDYRCPWAIFARGGGGEGWGGGGGHWRGGKTWPHIPLWMLQAATPSGHLTHVCLCRCDLGGRDELHELGQALESIPTLISLVLRASLPSPGRPSSGAWGRDVDIGGRDSGQLNSSSSASCGGLAVARMVASVLRVSRGGGMRGGGGGAGGGGGGRGLEELVVVDCAIGDEGARELLQSVAHAPGLGAAETKFGTSGPGFASIRHLDLSRNGIGKLYLSGQPELQSQDAHRDLVASMFAALPTSLRTLRLSGNGLGPAGAAMLSDACTGWCQLTKLELAGCYLADEGAIELSVGLAECAALCLLDLSGNSITDEGAGALAESVPELACSSLRLILSRNAIGVDGICALLKAMAHASSSTSTGEHDWGGGAGGRAGGGGGGAADRVSAQACVELQANMIDAQDVDRIAALLCAQFASQQASSTIDAAAHSPSEVVEEDLAAVGEEEAAPAKEEVSKQAQALGVDLRRNQLGQEGREKLRRAALSVGISLLV
jgi:predicted nicotinamide N-methyase